MEMSESFERSVEAFMQPIRTSGYDALPYDNASGSIEGQLRRYLFDATNDCKWEAYDWLFNEDYGNSNGSDFHIAIKTIIGKDEMKFTFLGKFEPRSSHMVSLKGIEVSSTTFMVSYPYSYGIPLPKPDEMHKASLALLKPKQKSTVRIRRESTNKGRKL